MNEVLKTRVQKGKPTKLKTEVSVTDMGVWHVMSIEETNQCNPTKAQGLTVIFSRKMRKISLKHQNSCKSTQ